MIGAFGGPIPIILDDFLLLLFKDLHDLDLLNNFLLWSRGNPGKKHPRNHVGRDQDIIRVGVCVAVLNRRLSFLIAAMNHLKVLYKDGFFISLPSPPHDVLLLLLQKLLGLLVIQCVKLLMDCDNFLGEYPL